MGWVVSLNIRTNAIFDERPLPSLQWGWRSGALCFIARRAFTQRKTPRNYL
jgi:hypothetical protein